MINDLLIVCIGNICRSPMGEALFRSKFINTSSKIKVHSAGLRAMSGFLADPLAVEIMKSVNIDISGHIARQLTEDLVFGADLILVMTSEQKTQLEIEFPSSRGRVHRLGKWESIDIIDPYKRPLAIFEQSFSSLVQSVDDWYEKLWN